MSNIKACLSHNHDDWKTPQKLYAYFVQNGYIDCFPYLADYNEYDNRYVLSKLFVNPPYSQINSSQFLNWCLDQLMRKCLIALLIPSRTDTKFFNYLIKYHLVSYIVFFKGRLHFNESKSAPFPSMLLFLRCNDSEYPNIPIVYSYSLDEFVRATCGEFGIRSFSID